MIKTRIDRLSFIAIFSVLTLIFGWIPRFRFHFPYIRYSKTKRLSEYTETVDIPSPLLQLFSRVLVTSKSSLTQYQSEILASQIVYCRIYFFSTHFSFLPPANNDREAIPTELFFLSDKIFERAEFIFFLYSDTEFFLSKVYDFYTAHRLAAGFLKIPR